MIVEALCDRIEVRQLQLASSGSQERMLLVHGFERGEGRIGKTDRRDHDRESSARTDVEHSRTSLQVGDNVEAVDDVLDELGMARGSGQVDTAVPLLEEAEKSRNI